MFYALMIIKTPSFRHLVALGLTFGKPKNPMKTVTTDYVPNVPKMPFLPNKKTTLMF